MKHFCLFSAHISWLMVSLTLLTHLFLLCIATELETWCQMVMVITLCVENTGRNGGTTLDWTQQRPATAQRLPMACYWRNCRDSSCLGSVEASSSRGMILYQTFYNLWKGVSMHTNIRIITFEYSSDIILNLHSPSSSWQVYLFLIRVCATNSCFLACLSSTCSCRRYTNVCTCLYWRYAVLCVLYRCCT